MLKRNLLYSKLGLFLFALCVHGYALCQETNSPSTNNGNGSSIINKGTIAVQDKRYIICTSVSPSKPNQNIESISEIKLQKNQLGDIYTLIRISLPSGVTSDEILSADIRIKLKTGTPQVIARAISKKWNTGVTWTDISDGIINNSTTSTGKLLENNWYAIDITSIMKDWVAGKYPNYGLMLEEIKDSAYDTFVSGYNKDSASLCPKFVITYKPAVHKKKIGKYPYQSQSLENGNCFAYALRDVDAIFKEDIGIDNISMKNIYEKAGISGALNLVKDSSIAYVNAHKKELGLLSFREISGYNAAIDTKHEYRIALRIGIQVSKNPKNPFQFDYHWRVQLSDGTWAEKLGLTDSWVVPGTNRNVDPEHFPWDQNKQWGLAKWDNFYTSDVIFFAVKKQSDSFTNHKHKKTAVSKG